MASDGPLPPRPPQPDQPSQWPTGHAAQPPVVPMAPPYPQPAQAQSTNGLAVAALILGIVGFVMILPILGPILGIVLGIIALNQIKHGKGAGRGLAHTGLWLGVAGLVLQVLIFGVLIAVSFMGIQEKAVDTQQKTELSAAQNQLEAFFADNGYYPAQITDMPNFSVPTTPPPIGETPFSYEPTPAGCVGAINTGATGSSNSPTCMGYSIKVKLSDGTEYTKTSPFDSGFNMYNTEIDTTTN